MGNYGTTRNITNNMGFMDDQWDYQWDVNDIIHSNGIAGGYNG
jgi:hypothetical protein